jgi:hypothetical protein
MENEIPPLTEIVFWNFVYFFLLYAYACTKVESLLRKTALPRYWVWIVAISLFFIQPLVSGSLAFGVLQLERICAMPSIFYYFPWIALPFGVSASIYFIIKRITKQFRQAAPTIAST